jgi:hypothetical protein
MFGSCSNHGEIRKACNILIGIPEERRCDNDIKMDPTEIVCESVELIQLAQERFQWRIFVKTTVSAQVS